MSALFGLTSTGKNLSPMNPLAELVLVDSGSMEIDAREDLRPAAVELTHFIDWVRPEKSTYAPRIG